MHACARQTDGEMGDCRKRTLIHEPDNLHRRISLFPCDVRVDTLFQCSRHALAYFPAVHN